MTDGAELIRVLAEVSALEILASTDDFEDADFWQPRTNGRFTEKTWPYRNRQMQPGSSAASNHGAALTRFERLGSPPPTQFALNLTSLFFGRVTCDTLRCARGDVHHRSTATQYREVAMLERRTQQRGSLNMTWGLPVSEPLLSSMTDYHREVLRFVAMRLSKDADAVRKLEACRSWHECRWCTISGCKRSSVTISEK